MDKGNVLQVQFHTEPQPEERIRIFLQCPRCHNINVVDKRLDEAPEWAQRSIAAKRQQLAEPEPEPMPTEPPKIDIDEVIEFGQMLEKGFHLPTLGAG
jgi:phage FluMu protein Com